MKTNKRQNSLLHILSRRKREKILLLFTQGILLAPSSTFYYSTHWLLHNARSQFLNFFSLALASLSYNSLSFLPLFLMRFFFSSFFSHPLSLSISRRNEASNALRKLYVTAVHPQLSCFANWNSQWQNCVLCVVCVWVSVWVFEWVKPHGSGFLCGSLRTTKTLLELNSGCSLPVYLLLQVFPFCSVCWLLPQLFYMLRSADQLFFLLCCWYCYLTRATTDLPVYHDRTVIQFGC